MCPVSVCDKVSVSSQKINNRMTPIKIVALLVTKGKIYRIRSYFGGTNLNVGAFGRGKLEG